MTAAEIRDEVEYRRWSYFIDEIELRHLILKEECTNENHFLTIDGVGTFGMN